VDRPKDDDADYEPMEEDPELTKEDVVMHTMAISKALECARWIGLEAAIQASPPPSSHASENLPPSRPFCSWT
jgi:hypothetical protein